MGSSRARDAPRTPASTGSRSSPPTTRWSTSSGRRGRTAERTTGVARSRGGCASRRRSWTGSASACGNDFIIGLAVSMDERSAPALSMAELAEIVAWHDARRAMDYVTCGTGSYFDFYPIIPVSLYEQQLGVPFAAELKRVVTHALVQAESHIRTPEAAEAVLAARSGRPGQHRARPDRRPAPGRQGPRRSCRGRPAVHLVQPDVLGPPLPRLLDLVPGEPIRGPRVRVGRRPVRAGRDGPARARGRRRAGGPRGGAGRGGARPPRHAPGAPARSSAASSGSPAGNRRAARSRTCWRGTGGGSRRWASTCGSGRRRPPPMSRPRERTRSCSRPGRGRRRPGSSGRCRWSIACPARNAPTRCRSTTCSTAGRSWALACSSSTTSGTGAGSGRPLHLAEAGHEVTIVTSAAVVGGGLFHSAADVPLRGRFSAAGGTMRPQTVVLAWDDEGRHGPLDAHRRHRTPRGGHPGHRRDARRRDLARERADRRGRPVPRDRRLRGTPPSEPRVLRGPRARPEAVRGATPRPRTRCKVTRDDHHGGTRTARPAAGAGRLDKPSASRGRWSTCPT